MKKDLYEMSEQEFKDELAKKTSTGHIRTNANRIYDFLSELFETNCYDSVLREWAFQWYAENNLGKLSFSNAYDEIYYKWLNKN
jgi:hypothetical protein